MESSGTWRRRRRGFAALWGLWGLAAVAAGLLLLIHEARETSVGPRCGAVVTAATTEMRESPLDRHQLVLTVEPGETLMIRSLVGPGRPQAYLVKSLTGGGPGYTMYGGSELNVTSRGRRATFQIEGLSWDGMQWQRSREGFVCLTSVFDDGLDDNKFHELKVTWRRMRSVAVDEECKPTVYDRERLFQQGSQ